VPNSLHSQVSENPAGFPKNARLLTAHQYSRVFANAKAFRDPLFTLLARTSEADSARLGLVIAKKKVKLSVQRNRIKRVARESFRRERQQLPSLDIILIAGRGMDRADNSALSKAFKRQWHKMSSFYTHTPSSST
jgi:ribonuclease P protein component